MFEHLQNKQGVFILTPTSKQMNNWTKPQTPVRRKYNTWFLPIGSKHMMSVCGEKGMLRKFIKICYITNCAFLYDTSCFLNEG